MFYNLLEEEAGMVLEAAQLLHTLLNDYRDVEERRRQIKDVEHRCDELVHETYRRLNRTFITPIDHEDLARLASRCDEVVDIIYAVVNRLHLYEIKEATPRMKEFAGIIIKAASEVNNALLGMRRINEQEIDRRAQELHRLENEADELLNRSVAELFKSREGMEVIKLKEIYEYLELITDKCDDVTDVLRDIVIMHA